MAENEDGQEKSEEPTGKRLADAKKKGQVPRSRELNTMALTMMGVITLLFMAGIFQDGFWQVFTHNFQVERQDVMDVGAMTRHLREAMVSAFFMVLPFFLVMMVVAIASSIALGGFNISFESMTPKLSKMNPLKGFKRMFATKGLVELLKSIAKFILIGGTVSLLLSIYLADFVRLADLSVEMAVANMLEMIGWFTFVVSSTLILVALFDVPFQLWSNKKELKMTLKEVKDEAKETDGRPEVKRRIRQVQMEMAQRRMMEEVPNADVIITNPAHFAVALKYKQFEMNAPVVIAKGMDLVAANIREIAEDNDIMVIESPLLARAIYFTTELNDPIPAGLYLIVAKVLAYVYQLQANPFETRDDERMQTQWDVPDEFRFDASGNKVKPGDKQ